jgi:hypothetical protein
MMRKEKKQSKDKEEKKDKRCIFSMLEYVQNANYLQIE